MGKAGGLRPAERRAREAVQAAIVADRDRLAGIGEVRKKKNPGKRDRFGRRFDGETVLGGRAGLDEATTARFGATPTGGKTILGV